MPDARVPSNCSRDPRTELSVPGVITANWVSLRNDNESSSLSVALCDRCFSGCHAISARTTPAMRCYHFLSRANPEPVPVRMQPHLIAEPFLSRSANPRSAVRGRFRDLRCPRRDFKAQLGLPRFDDVEENAQRRRMTHLYTGCHAFAGRWANAAILPRHCSPGAPRRMYGRGLHPKDRAATGLSLPV